MSIYVGLYVKNSHGDTPVGVVTFLSLIRKDGNSLVFPSKIITAEEVEQIRKTLCQLPQINSGTVGEYHWKASNNTLTEEMVDQIPSGQTVFQV